jgi:hypothetical protein
VRRINDASAGAVFSFLIPTTPLAASYHAEWICCCHCSGALCRPRITLNSFDLLSLLLGGVFPTAE